MTTAKNNYGLRELERRLGQMTLSGFLRAWRLSEGLSQSAFARRIGISPANLCDIEKRRKHVSAKKAAQFARKIGYSPHILVQLALNDALAAAGLRMKVCVEVA